MAVYIAMVLMKTPMFFKGRVVARETATVIRGVLVDAAGQPGIG